MSRKYSAGAAVIPLVKYSWMFVSSVERLGQTLRWVFLASPHRGFVDLSVIAVILLLFGGVIVEASRGHLHIWSRRNSTKTTLRFAGQQSSVGVLSDHQAPAKIEESGHSSKTLKIALVISEFPALNETFILDQITGLINRGHAVDIYATAPKGEPTVHEEIQSYELLARTVYRDSKKFEAPDNPLLRLYSATPLLVRGLLQNPAECLNSINIFRAGWNAASLSDLYEAAPFLTRSCQYDIIHCHFPPNGELATILRDRGIIGGKIVTSFHGYNLPHFKNGRIWDLYGNVARHGDLFLTCSEHMKGWYEGHGWGEGKTIVHRYGLRTELFSASVSRQPGNGDVRLLSVGRFVGKKGFKYAIAGVAKVVQRFPNVRYEIVGDGEERPALERLITELGAAENIRLVGWRNRSEILQFYKRAHIFLAPSVTADDGDQEGVPLVLHEALASGIPAISTYHTGIPELVTDGESGFLVGERDPEAIADRLTYLMEHPETWDKMGQKGRRHVEQHHDLGPQMDRLVQIYRLLIDEDFPKLQRLVVALK